MATLARSHSGRNSQWIACARTRPQFVASLRIARPTTSTASSTCATRHHRRRSTTGGSTLLHVDDDRESLHPGCHAQLGASIGRHPGGAYAAPRPAPGDHTLERRDVRPGGEDSVEQTLKSGGGPRKTKAARAEDHT